MVDHKKADKISYLRLTPLQRGMIYMGVLVGMTSSDISAKVAKGDGGKPSAQTVADTARQAEANGGSCWDGVLQGHAGRPRKKKLCSLDKEITKLVLKKRGSAQVTAEYVWKVIRAARKVSLRTIQRRLREAGLRWLRRRRKTLLSKEHRAA